MVSSFETNSRNPSSYDVFLLTSAASFHSCPPLVLKSGLGPALLEVRLRNGTALGVLSECPEALRNWRGRIEIS